MGSRLCNNNVLCYWSTALQIDPPNRLIFITSWLRKTLSVFLSHLVVSQGLWNPFFDTPQASCSCIIGTYLKDEECLIVLRLYYTQNLSDNIPGSRSRNAANLSVKKVWSADGSLCCFDKGTEAPSFLRSAGFNTALATRPCLIWPLLIWPWRENLPRCLFFHLHISGLAYLKPRMYWVVEAEPADGLLFWIHAVTCFHSSVWLKLLPLSWCRLDTRPTSEVAMLGRHVLWFNPAGS